MMRDLIIASLLYIVDGVLQYDRNLQNFSTLFASSKALLFGKQLQNS